MTGTVFQPHQSKSYSELFLGALCKWGLGDKEAWLGFLIDLGFWYRLCVPAGYTHSEKLTLRGLTLPGMTAPIEIRSHSHGVSS